MLFISYSSADREIAIKLQHELAMHHLDIWLDVGQFPIGEQFVSHIASALNSSSQFLSVDSSSSRASYWASREVAAAARLRRHGLMNRLTRLCVGLPGPPMVEFDRTFTSVVDATSFLKDVPLIKHTGDCPNGNVVTLTLQNHLRSLSIWYGFSDALAELDAWTTNSTRGFWISGPPASGKSSLAHVWLAASQQIGYGNDRTLDIQLWSFGPMTPTAPSVARAQLRELRRDTPLLVCVDGLDEFRWTDSQWFEVLSDLFSFGAKVLVTSRHAPVVYSSEFTHLVLRSMSSSEVKLLLRDLGLGAEGQEAIAARANGNPLYVAMIRDGLKTGRITVDDLVRSFPIVHK